MLTAEQQEALGEIAQASVEAENITGCPAELSAAQCILESGWLKHCPGNNCFGIKKTDDSAVYAVTHEFLSGRWIEIKSAFEAYPSLMMCFTAHARLIQGGRYSDAWRAYEEDPHHDLDRLIRGISSIYATDPEYVLKILRLAHDPHVTAAIQCWRNRMVA